MHGMKQHWVPGLIALLIAGAGCGSVAVSQTRGAGGALTGERRSLTAGNDGFSNQPYMIAPGDVVMITFRYTPEFNDEAMVGPDGRLQTKIAGDLRAAGLTISQLKAAIVESSSETLVKPEVSLTLKEFDRPHVYVAGEVAMPGRQDLRRPTTALQAILMSGGPKDDAALGRVLLFRHIDADTAEVHVLQLGRYGRKARKENDMLLQAGDMLLVRRDVPAHIERFVKIANLGFYLNPLQNVSVF